MIFSIPYILLITFYGFMAWWYQSVQDIKTRMFNIIVCLTVTLLFWGFRGFCFYDWMSYYPIFNNINTRGFFPLTIEPGFTALMMVCKAFYKNWHFFVFICTCINLTLLTRFLYRHTENLPLGLMLFTAMGGLFFMTDLMRNSIAIFIFINSLDYIRERNCLKYMVSCVLAISFHYSAILYIPLYFFLNMKISKWIFAGIFLIGCIIFTLHIPIFTNSLSFILSIVNPDLELKVRFYLLEVANKTPGLDLVFIERLFTGFMVLCFIDKLRALRKDANIFINCILLYFVFTFYFGEFVTLSTRMALLFVCGYWIVWMDLIKCFAINNNRRLYIIIISAYCVLRMIGLTKSVLANYDNILIDSEPYQIRQLIFNKNFKSQ